MTYVNFTDEKQTRIDAVFGAPQPDSEIWLHQGEVEDDDPRLKWFYDHPFGDAIIEK